MPQGSEGKTRDLVGDSAGLSGRTLDKAKAVKAAAADRSLPQPVREIAKQSLANLSQPDAKIDREFKRVEAAKLGTRGRSGSTSPVELNILWHGIAGKFSALLFDMARAAERTETENVELDAHAALAYELYLRIAEKQIDAELETFDAAKRP